MAIINMTDLDLAGKRVCLRQDLNVPLQDGKVANDKRIRASIPSIRHALDAGASVLVLSHLGRPTEGEFDAQLSLAPVAEHMSKLLGVPVELAGQDWIDGVELAPGKVILGENVRFLPGEKKNDPELGKKMAALCDIYVMDAFGTAHRAQASTNAALQFAPVACAGPLMAGELEALGKALEEPARPLLAVVGGSKVSTKLTLLGNLLEKVDQLIVAGGIANTFLAAKGLPVGKSLYEPDLMDEALALLEKAKAHGAEIPLPTDTVVAASIDRQALPRLKDVADVGEDDMILDVGPQTAKAYADLAAKAGTVVWNGPLGVFEYDQFAGGTKVLGHGIIQGNAFSIAGGGDTVKAVEDFGFADDISYISTGGGAFLEFLEGKKLPAVAMLEERGTK